MLVSVAESVTVVCLLQPRIRMHPSRGEVLDSF